MEKSKSLLQPQPLRGVRVLELARILAGPWLGQVLADLGADVVKVESTGGDDTRTWGPPFVGADAKTAAYFHSCNRGKKSLTADFGNETDLAMVKKLAGRADVVIENFKVGGLKKFGLDYHSLNNANPRLVYCSITGFGQTGPYAARAGYDYIIQGMSGFMDITGPADGQPQKIGVALADIITALYGAIGVLTALYQREQTGRGQWVDMALFDSMVGVLANQASNYFASGRAPTRLGNVHPNIAPYQVFYCRGDKQAGTTTGNNMAHEKPFVLACGNDGQFQKLMIFLGQAAVAHDARFITNAARVKNRKALVAILEKLFAPFARDELLAGLEKIGVPAGPINTIAEAMADPQIIARQMVMNLPLMGVGSVDGKMGDNMGSGVVGGATGDAGHDHDHGHGHAGGAGGNMGNGNGNGDGAVGVMMQYLRTPIVFNGAAVGAPTAAPDHPADPAIILQSWGL
ncbi:MAG: CaiB/BaiF CoA-transferase family protein [Alphaproteobacteria bacterium]|nr:CaiB/BaiF CoA-transferase family protein [Alphaproteobacteria bacterium]